MAGNRLIILIAQIFLVVMALFRVYPGVKQMLIQVWGGSCERKYASRGTFSHQKRDLERQTGHAKLRSLQVCHTQSQSHTNCDHAVILKSS